MTLSEFFFRLSQSPAAAVAAALTLGVMIVNGLTDAPVAITGCVSSGAMRPKAAVAMAAVCNLAGAAVSALVSPGIAEAVTGSVNLGGEEASLAVCAGLAAVIAWSLAAYAFGIPTSESHGLIAALSGAAMALNGRAGVGTEEWKRVLWGLLLSSLAGFALGFVFSKLTAALLSRADPRRSDSLLTKGLILGGGAMSVMHGAQDGQKLMAVMLLCADSASAGTRLPAWLALLTALAIALGSSFGGMRIIDTVGRRMVRPEKYRAVSADLAGALGLLGSSLLGLPVSTTHTHTSAVMGAGASEGTRGLDLAAAGDMVTAWLLTFPACGALGFIGARLLMIIF